MIFELTSDFAPPHTLCSVKYACFNVIEVSRRRGSRKEEGRLGGGVKYLCVDPCLGLGGLQAGTVKQQQAWKKVLCQPLPWLGGGGGQVCPVPWGLEEGGLLSVSGAGTGCENPLLWHLNDEPGGVQYILSQVGTRRQMWFIMLCFLLLNITPSLISGSVSTHELSLSHTQICTLSLRHRSHLV